MNTPFSVSLAPLAALLLAGSALAQTIPSPNPSGVEADRIDRRCTSTALSADASAPCSDDVRNDGPRESPIVVRPPSSGMVGSGNTSAGSTGTSMGTTGMPSTGSPNSGTSSMQGATGTGPASAIGATQTPARR
jgi:hypothetical protein